MKHHTRVAVIGGGVTGCSILYHLTKAGWTDVTLIERSELTAGSTWHAAGNLYTLTAPANAQKLHAYTLALYPRLEAESGQSIGYHATGGLTVAADSDQVMALTEMRAQGRRNGIEAEWIGFDEARERAPILDTAGLRGILYEPGKGHVDPASVTQAYATAARNMGACILRNTPVQATTPRPGGGWCIETANGDIEAGVIVNAAGLWAREVAAMAGITLPLAPVEHQYLVTETIPEIAAMDHRLPTISEIGVGFYSRQEGSGLLLGAYEEQCRHWSLDGTPSDFGHELLPNDLERLEAKLAVACQRFPALARTGIKQVVNGPMILSPDLAPLIGPHPALRGYYCAAGVMTGFNQAAGIGKVLTQWIIEGEPELDVSFWDVGRFGHWAGRRFTRERTKYYYENRDEIPYPHKECPAGRPLRTFPAYDIQHGQGAVFGFAHGWETPLWYASSDGPRADVYSWGRGNWFPAVGAECRTTRSAAGLFEISSFAKYRISGPGAEQALCRLMAGHVPRRPGHVALCPMLAHSGRLLGDFTLARVHEDTFMLMGSAAMQGIHRRWFAELLPTEGITFEDLTESWCGLMVCGPRAPAILDLAAGHPGWSEVLPFMGVAAADLNGAPEALVARLSFTGETGFEIYAPMAYHRPLYRSLLDAGFDHGLKPAGGRALMELRLEKSFPAWGLELSSDYGPAETGLDRFVAWERPDFIGRTPALKAREAGPAERLSTLVVDASGADCIGGEPIFHDDTYVGYVTSGGFGHVVEESLALGYLPPSLRTEDAGFEIEVRGNRRPARLSMVARHDPAGTRFRTHSPKTLLSGTG